MTLYQILAGVDGIDYGLFEAASEAEAARMSILDAGGDPEDPEQLDALHVQEADPLRATQGVAAIPEWYPGWDG